jgi:hypothetical protein
LIESNEVPSNSADIAQFLDEKMRMQNIYYKDLIEGKVLQPLKITWLPVGSFHHAMKQGGKLGGQNKVPRLANHRNFADLLCQTPS